MKYKYWIWVKVDGRWQRFPYTLYSMEDVNRLAAVFDVLYACIPV